MLVPAYDDPLLWEGHGSMIEEIHKQISPVKPDAVFCSVGGGGLFGGVMTGCRKVGWDDGTQRCLHNTVRYILTMNDGQSR